MTENDSRRGAACPAQPAAHVPYPWSFGAVMTVTDCQQPPVSDYIASNGNRVPGQCEREGGTTGISVSYTHLRAHETPEHLVCRLLLEKKKKSETQTRVRAIKTKAKTMR
eukprot:TRINITY_DN17558_c0_g1_i2.p1 TRINITY_DN17558_c0_g1~~TRINITY_DN17558_c0_g1_i2.p1  ORF type:complete len:110 (-),score=6.14 TRINITY_DN17558_c0_g1_i2:6-335(-)